MNCSQQTNGAHVAAANMTTLLQKNCIKTLQMNNGSVVVVGTAPVQNASMLNSNVVPITNTVAPLTTQNLQTHTMIANASHLQPIQAFHQYQQIQTVSAAGGQPQYLLINPTDGTVFRPIVTTTAQPTTQNAIVNNTTIYQQTPQTIVTQNLPKIGAIKKCTNGALTQQKLVKYVSSTLKPIPQQQQHQQQQQQHFIVNSTNVGVQPHIINNKIVTTNSGVQQQQQQHQQHQQQQQQQQHRQIVSIANGTNIIGNPINTITTTSTNHIVTNHQQNVQTVATPTSINATLISNQQFIATNAKSQQIHETVNVKNNNSNNSQMSIQSTNITNQSNNTTNTTITTAATTTTTPTTQKTTIENLRSSQQTRNTETNFVSVKEEQTEFKQEIIQNETCQPAIDETNTTEKPTDTNTAVEQTVAAESNGIDDENEPEPEIDIVINNVVCSFSVRCHLNLRQIALNGRNVEFRRENGMVTMKLRRPYTTASIWSSGRITCTGATSEDQAKVGARRYARCLQNLGFPVRFSNFRVVNVLGTCSMPWAIKIVSFSENFKQDASYEPELHPGVTYKLRTPKATLKIFSTGSITVTAGSVADVQAAIEHIFPLVYEFRKQRTTNEPPPPPIEMYDPDNDDEIIGGGGGGGGGGGDGGGIGGVHGLSKTMPKKAIKRKYPFGHSENDPHEDNMTISDEDLDDLDDLM